MTTVDDIRREIGTAATTAATFVRGRRIETPSAASEAAAIRADLAALKARAEAARDAEYLPLITAAKAVMARYGPPLAELKRADDLVRLALKAWKKREKQAGGAP